LKRREPPEKVKKIRENYEKELKNRIKEEQGRESNGMLKFILSNLLWIEWKIIHSGESTGSSFIRETLLPLCEELFSVEESSSLPHDAFSSDAILFGIIKEPLESTRNCEMLCCEGRKKLFGMILSHSSFNFFAIAREEVMSILKSLIMHTGEREMVWIMKEGGTMCVIKKMRDKRERDDSVRQECFETLSKVLECWKWGIKKEVVWVHSVSIIIQLLSFCKRTGDAYSEANL
jgi:hypothetical protein